MGGTNAPRYQPAVVQTALTVVPSRNRAVPRYVGSQRRIQDSGVEIDDSNNLSVPGTLALGDLATTGFVLPNTDGTLNQVLTTDGGGLVSWQTNAGGDVSGPAGATDEAIARYNLATGKVIQNSTVTISDAGAITVNPAGTPFTLPTADGTLDQVLTTNGTGTVSWADPGGGDVVGPGSSTDHAVARYDLATGKVIQNSTVTISDAGAITVNPAGTPFTLPTADGSAGFFLQTNGGGVVSFVSGSPTAAITFTGASADADEVPRFTGAGLATTDSLLRIDASGNLHPSAGTPSVGTLAAPYGDLFLSGIGETFYEEGTFSSAPIITDEAGNPPDTITYTEQTGIWKRIGNLVFVNIRMTTSAFSVGAVTGELQIRNFEKTAAQSTVLPCSFQIIDPTGNNQGIATVAEIQSGGTYAIVRVSKDNNPSEVIQIEEIEADGGVLFFYISGCYPIS